MLSGKFNYIFGRRGCQDGLGKNPDAPKKGRCAAFVRRSGPGAIFCCAGLRSSAGERVQLETARRAQEGTDYGPLGLHEQLDGAGEVPQFQPHLLLPADVGGHQDAGQILQLAVGAAALNQLPAPQVLQKPGQLGFQQLDAAGVLVLFVGQNRDQERVAEDFCVFQHREDHPAQKLFQRRQIGAAGNRRGRQLPLLSPLVCSPAKTGGAVNGGRSPFILTVYWLGWLCYFLPNEPI